MATYQELHELRNHADMVRRVWMAVADLAADILDGETTPVAARVDWAKLAIGDPEPEMSRIIHYVLVTNKGKTVAELHALTEVNIKNKVKDAVSALVAPEG